MIKIENKGGETGEKVARGLDISRRLDGYPPTTGSLLSPAAHEPPGRERRVRRTERVYFITTRFYRGDPAGSSLFALRCL